MRSSVAYPYKDPQLPARQRADDLLSRLSLEQKIAQLGCVLSISGSPGFMRQQLARGIGEIAILGGCQTAEQNAALARSFQRYLVEETEFGIPAILHVEALSGCALAEAQTFPHPVGLAASFNPAGVQSMADVIRSQMAATGIRHALSPVMDIARDLRWGRSGETYGEDPTLAAAMSVAYVRGLQGRDLQDECQQDECQQDECQQDECLSDGCAATGKHFLGYGMSEGGLNLAACHLTKRELREVYAKPFEAAIREAGLATVMNSYAEIDGEPVVSNSAILRGLLRGELSFKGVTVSDYTAINRLCDAFYTAGDIAQAGAQALAAGIDIELPQVSAYGPGLREMVKQGALDIKMVDRAVARVLTLKFRLGLFERPFPPEGAVRGSYHQPAQQSLSLGLAHESAVLLKNDGGLLPLCKDIGTIAVIGPNADSLRSLFGSYTWPATYEMLNFGRGSGRREQSVGSIGLFEEHDGGEELEKVLRRHYPDALTVRQAIERTFLQSKILFARGCGVAAAGREGFAEAVGTAMRADVVIMVLGGKCGWGAGCTAGEGIDSSSLELPGEQLELLKAVYAAGRPVILVHMDARPLCSPWAAGHIPAIVELWHPGENGGRAIADILSGAYCPGGRLPVTAIRSAGQAPACYAHRRGSGISGRGPAGMAIAEGYVNESGRPLFCFGHGLSYTRFDYSGLTIAADEDAAVKIGCRVTNAGGCAGDEVVQLYISDPAASVVRPVKELAGFLRLRLGAGESKEVLFTLQKSQLAFLDKEMRWVTEAGAYEVEVGCSCEDIRLRGRFEIEKNEPVCGGRAFYAQAAVEGAE